MLIKNKKTVAIAMSGGVDSSVGAILLKKKGYNVIGLSMHLISPSSLPGNGKGKTCCSMEDIIDAKKVAVKIGIPHFVINLEEEFKSHIIDPFIGEYLKGRTPNPCISCNNFLKFGLLRERARELGADLLATGHYARITRNLNGSFHLLKSVNTAKDQSYFLYRLNRLALKEIVFPIGNMLKDSVRKIALESGFMDISKKKESTDICFIPDGNYQKFICQSGKNTEVIKKGVIKNIDGTVIGKHDGIYNYTIGQRKGLGISHKYPLHVIKISPETNEIFVGTIENCYNDEMTINDFNFTDIDYLNKLEGINLTAKIRYSSADYPCEVDIITDGRKENTDNFSVKVKFKSPVKFITPGQSAVLYNGLRVVGGGIIA